MSGEHIQAVQNFECTDDAEVILKSKALLDSHPEHRAVEIWEGKRLVAHVAKTPLADTNAQHEGNAYALRSKPMYREPFKNRRCVVPATGYIEFTGPKGEKTAHLFTRADGQPIALAGLWDRWTSADKAERKETYTVVTTAPSAFAGQFHERMPLVLELDDVDAWLGATPDEAAALTKPAQDVLQERQLGKAINNVKNNVPELLA